MQQIPCRCNKCRKEFEGLPKSPCPDTSCSGIMQAIPQPGDVVIAPGFPYYCGGTISHKAPSEGVRVPVKYS